MTARATGRRRSSRFRPILLFVLLVAVGGIGLSVPAYLAEPSVAASPVVRAVAAAVSPPSTPLHLVGLGDSVMAGTACGCDGIVSEYADLLANRSGRQVSAHNFGADGATTEDLLSALRDDSDTRAAVRQADVVVIIIGANDLSDDLASWRAGSCSTACYSADVTAMGQRLGQVLDTVRSLAGSDATVLVTNYWNVFLDGRVAKQDGGQAELTFSTTVTASANKVIAAAASSHGATLVDLVAPFKGGGADPTSLLAADGDHPNATGVKAIVKALAAAG